MRRKAHAEREPLFVSERAAQEFARTTGARWVGARLRYLEKTDSTNERARRLADLGWPAGTVVVADCQTRGRGRGGRGWLCPARAGVLVSSVLPRPEGAEAAWLTAAGALAMVDAVAQAGSLELLVEWPNDLVALDGDAPGCRRKVGGVLVEARPGSGLAVLGVGLNVDVREEEFPPELRPLAGSLLTVFGTAPGRREVFGCFLAALESRLDRIGGLAEEFRRRSFTLGREVDVPPGAGRPAVRARAVDFDEEMRLVVRLPCGRTEAFASLTGSCEPGPGGAGSALGESA